MFFILFVALMVGIHTHTYCDVFRRVYDAYTGDAANAYYSFNFMQEFSLTNYILYRYCCNLRAIPDLPRTEFLSSNEQGDKIVPKKDTRLQGKIVPGEPIARAPC